MEKSGIIELYKTDAAGGERTADATLKGAKYGIYVEKTPGSSELKRIDGGEIITDEAGYGCIEGLPEGIYYVKEEIPSPGYQLDQNIYPVEITPELIADVKPVVKVGIFIDSEDNGAAEGLGPVEEEGGGADA